MDYFKDRDLPLARICDQTQETHRDIDKLANDILAYKYISNQLILS